MDKIEDKIANIQLEISDDILDEHIELLKRYWAFDDDFKLLNQPTRLRKDLGMTQKNLNHLVQEHSSMSFYLMCNSCNSMEYQEAKSQTQFRSSTSSLKKFNYSHNCSHCYNLDQEKRYKEQKIREELERQELEEKLVQYNIAIDNKVWKNLSGFENGVLKHAIQLNDISELKKHYFGKGMQCFKMLFTALRILEAEKLIFLTMESWDKNRIENYQFLKRLRKEYDYVQKPNTTIDNSSTVQINNQTKELKFKLTINKNQIHPYSPAHAGTVTFKERIVIEPGEEYVFGLWNRANEDLYLTMVPLENMENLPIQKRLQSLPIPIRKGVEDFLNSIGKGLWLDE